LAKLQAKQTKAIEDYKNALKLGYTKSIPEMYKAAGIEFNFYSNLCKRVDGISE
jgi:oligoendopeptidase F